MIFDLQTFRYDGTWSLEAAQKSALSGDLGLVLKDKAKHSAISSHLTKPFIFKDQPFIVQYEIMFQVIFFLFLSQVKQI